jgi:hypothetical protein
MFLKVSIEIGPTSTEQTENALLSELIQKLDITIKDERFMHKDVDMSFTRDRAFTFDVLLSFLMANLRKGMIGTTTGLQSKKN